MPWYHDTMTGFLHTELRTTNRTSKLFPLADPSSVSHPLLFGKEAAAHLYFSSVFPTDQLPPLTHLKAIDSLDSGCWLNWLRHSIPVWIPTAEATCMVLTDV